MVCQKVHSNKRGYKSNYTKLCPYIFAVIIVKDVGMDEALYIYLHFYFFVYFLVHHSYISSFIRFFLHIKVLCCWRWLTFHLCTGYDEGFWLFFMRLGLLPTRGALLSSFWAFRSHGIAGRVQTIEVSTHTDVGDMNMYCTALFLEKPDREQYTHWTSHGVSYMSLGPPIFCITMGTECSES